MAAISAPALIWLKKMTASGRSRIRFGHGLGSSPRPYGPRIGAVAGEIVFRRIEPDQCGSPALQPLFVQMDDQVTRTALDSATMQSAQPTVKRPVVTVVDDDPAVCGSLKFALELEGFVVRTYGSGAELLDVGGVEDCDCFVIDQRMPGMTGMDVVDALRKRRILTPVILIISHPSTALSARAQKAAVPIVEKPLLGNALVERIREACWA